MSEQPFIFGAQYYRAPTPEPACWEFDMARMRELGFNAVKLWVQWRWSHRRPDAFEFDDLDRLMDLAAEHALRVTINTVFDVAPAWLYDAFPDARQVDARGRAIEPFAVGHRQLGGHPGPCYNHPGALAERRRCMEAAVSHLADHPALSMWDVWNEPEQSFQARNPDMTTLTCYCAHCRAAFVDWLTGRYGQIDRLNRVWGRCYTSFGQVEVPRDPSTLTDFVDWREFHLDVMTGEARWRLETVRRLDRGRTAYLHVVPNTMTVFSSVTCVDDFALAEPCDVFAATMNGSPDFTLQVVSAARGKRCYNVESHVNFGSTRMHQRILGIDDLLRDLLPQVGLGVRGFLFWQYRAEVLGVESPAWGLVGLEGEDRPVTRAAQRFWAELAPHAPALLACPAPAASVGIWKSRRNEVFHFALDGTTHRLAESVSAWLDACYWSSLPTRFVSEAMLEAGDLEGLQLLVLPSPLYLSDAEADAIDRWVRGGGVVLTEAHLASYSATAGRHARRLPGAGLAERWGIRETDTTAVAHLGSSAGETSLANLSDDERNALGAAGAAGGEFVAMTLDSGETVWGASRFALLEAPDARVIATFSGGAPAVLQSTVGQGTVIYCASHPGRGAIRDAAGLRALAARAAAVAGAAPTLGADEQGRVHVDLLADETGPRYVLINCRADTALRLTLDAPGALRGIFTGMEITSGHTAVDLPARLVDLFVVER